MADDTTNVTSISAVDPQGLIGVFAPDGPEQVVHVVPDAAPAQFTWDYDKGARPRLNRLYEKAKGAQWNAETDLPWDTDVDAEGLAAIAATGFKMMSESLPGFPGAKWTDREWVSVGVETQRFAISQFLHGEQGALLATAKIVETVPWIDSKYYGATQVMDEARHVEVFAKYLNEKLGGGYPVNRQLGQLLDDLVADERWDITYLGMQIMVEGLALAAFGMMRAMTPDPLLKQLLQYVMADEARHVAFGVLSLAEVYEGLSASEIRDRQEFACEAAEAMRGRMAQEEVWARMGMSEREMNAFLDAMQDSPVQQMQQQLLFSKIIPNLNKIGLLDAGDGWLRTRFGELGLLQYAEAPDASEAYDEYAIAELSTAVEGTAS